MLIPEVIMRLCMFTQIKYPLQINSAVLAPLKEMVEVEVETQITLLVIMDTIPMDQIMGSSGQHSAPGGGNFGPADDPYGAGSDNSLSLESGRRCRHDWHIQQDDQFEKSMLAMNNFSQTCYIANKEHKIILYTQYWLSISPREITEMTP